MDGIPVFSFAGYSGSGKTTLIEKLVRRMKAAGIRVAVIKHDVHGVDIDCENKDSWRFTQAGADVLAVSCDTVTLLSEQRTLTFEQVLSKVHDVDLVIVEGYKKEALTQIGISRKANKAGLPAALCRYTAVITDDDTLKTQLPKFGLDDIEGIMDYIMNNMQDFTHFNAQGRAMMVDVGEKAPTLRQATAKGRVYVNKNTYSLIHTGGMKKGDVLCVAQVAGIMGAKRTSELIPMCHPVQTDGIDISLTLNESECCVDILASVALQGRTGVEMEALTAVSVAALTVYDMCKAVQRDIVISDICLVSKTGGIHGDFQREEDAK